MLTLRDILRSALIVVGSVLVASMAAWALDRAAAIPSLPPAAAALVVAATFWWRAPEGIGAFGLFALMAATLEHWLGLDLLLFDEIALLLLAAIAVVRHRVPNGRLRIGVAEIGLAVLALAGIASSLLEGVPALTMAAGLALLLKGVALFYLVSWLRLEPSDVARIGAVVIGIGVVVAVLGFVEWLDPPAFQAALGLPAFEQTRGGVTVVRSIFLHPALFGWSTAFTAILFYAIFIVGRSWWALLLAIVLSLGTVLSGRRTPLVGILVALVVGLASQLRAVTSARLLVRAWLPVGAALVLVLVLLLPTLGTLFTYTLSEYLPEETAVVEIFSDDPDADVVAVLHPRTALYIGSLAVARDRLPLGAGFGRYGSHLSRSEYSPIYGEYGLDGIAFLQPTRSDAVTDTYWPMVLGETGVVGLLGALLFIGAVLVRLWRATVAGGSTTERVIALGVLMVFAEGIVRSLTASVYTAPPIAYFILGAAGLSMAMRHTVAERVAETAADEPA